MTASRVSGGLSRRRFIAVAAAAAALPGAAQAETIWRGVALGAEASISLRGDRRAAEAALQAALSEIERVERQFSLYRRDSALSRLNAGARLPLTPDFAEMLALCDRLHRGTEGRFDPTIQPLWRALAEGRDAHAAAAQVGWARVEISADHAQLAPGQALTLNGVAQGVATDRVADALRRHGFEDALVDIGELRAGNGDWRVSLRDAAGAELRAPTLRDRAIATSSPGALRIGERSHILSPLGEAPHWRTVAVEARTAALADGLSTALCLADQAAVQRIIGRFGEVSAVTLEDQETDLRVLRG